jgi:hypothetical protein
MSDQPKSKKSAADLLKEAMSAKKAAAQSGKQKLRPGRGGARAVPDAERRGGKSRKVH